MNYTNNFTYFDEASNLDYLLTSMIFLFAENLIDKKLQHIDEWKPYLPDSEHLVETSETRLKKSIYIRSLQHTEINQQITRVGSNGLKKNKKPKKELHREELLIENIINEKKFRAYFGDHFLRSGESGFNYFSQLCEDLRIKRNKKQMAQIALMIYRGTQMNNQRPETFAKWYRTFCILVGCGYCADYKEANLRNIPESLKKLFSYVN